MSKNRDMIVFPRSAAAIGGAERVTYSKRYAWIYLPGETEPVRVVRSDLPPLPPNWTAFLLADVAQARKGAK